LTWPCEGEHCLVESSICVDDHTTFQLLEVNAAVEYLDNFVIAKYR
jgi:hypothetical protein